jgi:hypothetical protein
VGEGALGEAEAGADARLMARAPDGLFRVRGALYIE